ncbi:conserved exported protein of unknown function [Bartonella clarridgeiae 73]|uniref:Uncharacterized protein n=1 Tax=Bartonella clarridgeiae (strain CCUG 45776 / CIP 104772 / 73) TaxID=696125 RepID=E6YGD3_BARC7|nr:hypothetical protein [Bartonella clarridgeiae]WCR55471.1 MAG: hypothetical protein PG977_000864 [Bartonella clarridgeiae]CBI75921.1 conserved exported protein of unknown function [Bartonella clarridgeiae 73]
MSFKKATVITIITILGFILVTVGIGSVGANEKRVIIHDGYGISTHFNTHTPA